MRKLILGLAAAAIVATPVALTAAPAQAQPWHPGMGDGDGTPHCMSKYEWKHIYEYEPIEDAEGNYVDYSVGDSRYIVRAWTGTKGKVTDRTEYSDGELDLWIDYRQCMPTGVPASEYSTVSIY